MPTCQWDQCVVKSEVSRIYLFAKSFCKKQQRRRFSVVKYLSCALIFLISTLNMDLFQTQTYICNQNKSDLCYWKKSSFGAEGSPVLNDENPQKKTFSKVQLVTVPDLEGTERWLCVTESARNADIYSLADVRVCHNSHYDATGANRPLQELARYFTIQHLETGNRENVWLLLVNLTQNFTVRHCTNLPDVHENNKLQGDYGITTRHQRLTVSSLCKNINEAGKPRPVYRFKLESNQSSTAQNLSNGQYFRLRGYCKKPGKTVRNHLCYVKVMNNGVVKMRYLKHFINEVAEYATSMVPYNRTLYENLNSTVQVLEQIYSSAGGWRLTKEELSKKLQRKFTLFRFQNVTNTD